MHAPRSLLGLASLALVVSCSAESTPNAAASSPPASAAPASIVGTWAMEMTLGKTAAKAVRLGKPDATDAEIEAATKAAKQAAGPGPRLTFNADGTGTLEGMVFDHAIADPLTWKLVEETPERIVIDTWTAAKVESRMTFLVESPDVLVYADKPMKGEKIVRVK